MKMSIDIPETVNHQLKVFKAVNNYKNLETALIAILNEKLKLEETSKQIIA